MHRLAALSVAVALLAPSGAAFADGEMHKKHTCVAFHTNERKMVGPPYKDVAANYAADPKAAEKLAKKIKAGGAGVWGQLPMPPHPQLSDADALALAKYVLTIK